MMGKGTADEIIIALAEALGKERALKEQESHWLEQALRRENRRTWASRTIRGNGAKRACWEAKDDLALKRHLSRNRKVPEIARAMGKSQDAIWSRIRALRRSGKLPRRRERGPVAMAQAEA